MPFKSKPRKCKYCELPAARNMVGDRNKGWLRTCGNSICLRSQYKDPQICIKKRTYQEAFCTVCGQQYTRASGRQKWCAECVPNGIARRRMQRYDLSQPEYDLLMKNQNNKCALCANPPLVVDHNHSTGRVRGLLCGSCNLLVASADRKEWLHRAVLYVEKP